MIIEIVTKPRAETSSFSNVPIGGQFEYCGMRYVKLPDSELDVNHLRTERFNAIAADRTAAYFLDGAAVSVTTESGMVMRCCDVPAGSVFTHSGRVFFKSESLRSHMLGGVPAGPIDLVSCALVSVAKRVVVEI